MIKMQIIGRLGKDCVVNTVNGKNVINFSVAHSEKYKDSQGTQQEKTIWVDCAYWTERTAVAPYLTKGTMVFVEGQPEARSFQRNDGTPGASLSLRVRDLQLLGGRADSGGNYSNTAATNTAASPATTTIPSPSDITEPIDDLPF
jgi:single-strand DNA-binding protein